MGIGIEGSRYKNDSYNNCEMIRCLLNWNDSLVLVTMEAPFSYEEIR